MEQDDIPARYIYQESTDAPESFELSDLDMIMPATYVPFALIYRPSCSDARSLVVSALEHGLRATVDQIPMLLGRVRVRCRTGRLWVSRTATDHVALIVKDVPEQMSIKQGAPEDFPSRLLDPVVVLPSSLVGTSHFRPSSPEDEFPVSIFQITFMADYVVLSFALHHSCFDGASYDRIIARWAQNSRACPTQVLAPLDATVLDRSRLLSSTPQVSGIGMTPDYRPGCFTCSAANVLPMVPKILPAANNFKAVVYSFTRSSCESLQAQASANSSTPISTYVAVTSLLWMAVTRSRILASRFNESPVTTLVNSVDVRSRMQPPLSSDYLGNAVALACTQFQIDDLTMPQSFPRVANQVQKSIGDIDEAYVRDLIAWSGGVENKADIKVNLAAHLGWDFAVTSFRSASYYQSADFGFGSPLVFRSLFTRRDGCAFVYPPRPTSNADGGMEVCVCLEHSCQDLLGRDVEFSKHASVQGY